MEPRPLGIDGEKTKKRKKKGDKTPQKIHKNRVSEKEMPVCFYGGGAKKGKIELKRRLPPSFWWWSVRPKGTRCKVMSPQSWNFFRF